MVLLIVLRFAEFLHQCGNCVYSVYVYGTKHVSPQFSLMALIQLKILFTLTNSHINMIIHQASLIPFTLTDTETA